MGQADLIPSWFAFVFTRYKTRLFGHSAQVRFEDVDITHQGALNFRPLEILEDIVKFKWSDILKGGMAARKRKIELMEAEAKAPGKECAYVFDARKRFGPKI